MLSWAEERRRWNAEGRCAREGCSRLSTLKDGRYQYPDEHELLYCYECACLLVEHQGVVMLKLDEGSPDLPYPGESRAAQLSVYPTARRPSFQRSWDYARLVLALDAAKDRASGLVVGSASLAVPASGQTSAPVLPPAPASRRPGPLDRICPVCGAGAGSRCRSRTGGVRDVHAERRGS